MEEAVEKIETKGLEFQMDKLRAKTALMEVVAIKGGIEAALALEKECRKMVEAKAAKVERRFTGDII